MVLKIFLFISSFTTISAVSIVFLILDQPTEYHENRAQNLADKIAIKSSELGITSEIFRSSQDFSGIHGYWAIWPLISDLIARVDGKEIDWFFICEDETDINLENLIKILEKYNSNQDWFLGHGLRDLQPTIIHHYAFASQVPSKFLYPDFAAGFALTLPVLQRLLTKITSDSARSGFAIDAKHELAMLLWNDGAGIALIDVPEFCTYSRDDVQCATQYSPDVSLCSSGFTVANNLYIAVKTCQKFHKTRIVVLKRTWGKDIENIEYFSDAEDHFIPTTQLGVANTERGHCGKTMAIIKRFVSKPNYKSQWLMIVDDDTLVSVNRLIKLLRCNDIDTTVIIGERYGYGFNVKGEDGYDYPTGGSGMIFSPSAAEMLTKNCYCPSLDSPDDMILGMCARNLQIPIVHSAALHQARPIDYSQDYLKRIPPISFHKHYEIDPYLVYKDYLEEKIEENIRGQKKEYDDEKSADFHDEL